MKVYAFKIKDGILMGLEVNGAPCAECVQAWLEARDIPCERTKEFNEVIAGELKAEADPSVFYEVDNSGSSTRLECYVERHPKCGCNGNSVQTKNSKRLNFAFSPMHKIKAARFGTPSGNVWLAQVITTNGDVRYGVDSEREAARLQAAFGTDNGLEGTCNQVIAKYTQMNKQPMLVVGSNNWMRSHIPFFLLQQYDVYLLFYPNATRAWVVGCVAFSRTVENAEPLWSYSAACTIEEALKQAMWGLLKSKETNTEVRTVHSKLNAWLIHWIYRCPKITLKDVLHLEAYSRADLEVVEAHEPIQPIFRKIIGGKTELAEASPQAKLRLVR